MTNHALFEQHRVLVTALFVARIREGEDVSTLVATLIDPDDPEVPDALADALAIEDEEARGDPENAGILDAVGMCGTIHAVTPSGRADSGTEAACEDTEPTTVEELLGMQDRSPKKLRLGTVLRIPLAELLAATHPEASMALGEPTKLSRAPCVVIAGGALTLVHFPVPVLVWAPGGDA